MVQRLEEAIVALNRIVEIGLNNPNRYRDILKNHEQFESLRALDSWSSLIKRVNSLIE